MLVLTPWGQHDVLLVQLGHEFFPSCGCFLLLVQSVYGILIHVVLDLFEQFSQGLHKTVLRKLNFFTIVSEDTSHFVLFNILWTEFDSNWNTLEFPMVVFPTWVIIVSVVIMNSDIRLF
jgi:hypothetical protein